MKNKCSFTYISKKLEYYNTIKYKNLKIKIKKLFLY